MARIRTVKPDRWPTINAVTPFVCTLYVIEEDRDSYLKIGIASHPARRLCSLQSGNPRRLKIVALYEGTRATCFEIERLAHKFFGVQPRTEWFLGDKHDAIKFLNSFIDDEASA